MGPVVRVDQNTLLRLKGKFARVCLTRDITHPLLGSLTIAMGNFSMEVSLIYKGLHDVCPLCGGEPHQLDNYPKLHAQQKVQVVVQKFEENSDCQVTKEPLSSTSRHPTMIDNWVTVSPKKRVRPALGPRTKKYSTLKP